MNDLRSKLQQVKADDKKRDLSLLQRRFIVTEGIFRDVGDIAPLPELAKMKEEYVCTPLYFVLGVTFAWRPSFVACD